MTTDAKCIAVVLSLILILKEQRKENNKMKLKDVMQLAKCGVLGALVAAGLTAFAAEDAAVEYVGADGMLKTLPAGGYELVTAATDTIGGGRWYVVKGTVSRGMIVVDGSAHLVLCDGAKLIVKSAIEQAGIAVCEGHSLDIWGQSNGTGELTAMGVIPERGLAAGPERPAARWRFTAVS